MSSNLLKNKIFYPKKIPHPQKKKIKNTADNFYEVQTTKCTKSLYQTDTIRPTVQYKYQHSTVQGSVLGPTTFSTFAPRVQYSPGERGTWRGHSAVQRVLL